MADDLCHREDQIIGPGVLSQLPVDISLDGETVGALMNDIRAQYRRADGRELVERLRGAVLPPAALGHLPVARGHVVSCGVSQDARQCLLLRRHVLAVSTENGA